MNEIDPSDRDEMIVAFLDGEATPEERALIQGDPALLARAEELAAVMALVAAPVAPPPSEVREAHIAAALAASSTTPTVSSLDAARARRSMRPLGAAVGAAAALLVAIAIAVPVLRSGDDEDFDASGGAEAALDLGEADSADDGATSEEAATMAAPEGADTRAGDSDGGGETEMADDGGAAPSGGAEMESDLAEEGGDEGSGAPEDSAADESADDDGGTDVAADDPELGSQDVTFDPGLLVGVAVVDVGQVSSMQALIDAVVPGVRTGDFPVAAPDELTSLACLPQLVTLVPAPESIIAVGRAVLDGQRVQYVISDDSAGLVVETLDVAGCR